MSATTATFSSHEVYTPRFLNFYDLYVLRFSNRWVWRCPTAFQLDHYNRYVSNSHLDVGVGTGWYLDHCTFPTDTPRVVLMDKNEHCLNEATKRIQRYHPTTVEADLLRPIDEPLQPFDSIGLQYVLHCLPGTIKEKEPVIARLAELLNPGGVLFGSTILSEGVPLTGPAKRLLQLYNKKGIFGNQKDSLADLRNVLRRHFSEPRLSVQGSVAIFAAYRD